MITAIVFVQCQTDRIPEVAEQIVELDGVGEVYSVTGDVDLIVLVRVNSMEQVADVISDRINKIPGVAQTVSHLAFKTYSKRDEEEAFAIGVN